MIYIPDWVINILFLVTTYMAAIQHTLLKRKRNILNLQYFMVAFSLAMIWIVAVYNKPAKPWQSLVFFLIAVGGFSLIFYRYRRMPAKAPFK